jgi:hypothetical protein
MGIQEPHGPLRSNAMKRFIQQHAGQISGVLNGFDRMRFRGTLRLLAHTNGMRKFLNHMGVLLKDFKTYVQAVTDQIRETTEQLAKDHGRRVRYLDSPRISKEETARGIAEREGIREGLICVFSAVENCFSYEVRRDAEKRWLELRGRNQKCLHYYFYLQHPEFGFMHLRLQTWFPLSIHIALNGREWLARQLDTAGIGYRRRDNCFLELEDPRRAQELCDLQLQTRWKRAFHKLLHEFHPAHAEIFRENPIEYYWTLDESEWASDVMFRSPESLAALYPHLLRHGAYNFSSAEVMRFLGRKLTIRGSIHGRFQGDVVSDVAPRADHLRIKHRLNKNWIKMYDKCDSVLRVETTINDVRGLQVFRRKEGQTGGQRAWLPLRKGVADLKRRARISQAAHERYLEALAEVHATQSLGELTKTICQPTQLNGKRVRALQPWSAADTRLLAAVNRPEFTLNGFRNRDLRPLLFDTSETSPDEVRRQSAKVSRQLRLLRAHGLIMKVAKTHRYQLTAGGRTILAALQAAHQANPQQLATLAA